MDDELDDEQKDQFKTIMYFLEKEAARSSFMDWVNDIGIELEEYQTIMTLVRKQLDLGCNKFYFSGIETDE